jgi:hypothetical protein
VRIASGPSALPSITREPAAPRPPPEAVRGRRFGIGERGQATGAGQHVDQDILAFAIELRRQDAGSGGGVPGMTQRGNELFRY